MISIFIFAIDGVIINIYGCLSILIEEINHLFLLPKTILFNSSQRSPKREHKIYFVPYCITGNFNAEDT